MDELPVALWAYRTTLRQATRETSYALAFGVEARIPIKSKLKPLHSNNHVELEQTLDEIKQALDELKQALNELEQALDELEEKREQAAIRMVEYQLRVA